MKNDGYFRAEYYITEQGNILKDYKTALYILKENGNKIEWNLLTKPRCAYELAHRGYEGDINNKLFNFKSVFFYDNFIDGYLVSRSNGDWIHFRCVDVLKDELKEDNLEINLDDEQQLVNLLANKTFINKVENHLRKEYREIPIPESRHGDGTVSGFFSIKGKQQSAPPKENASRCTIS